MYYTDYFVADLSRRPRGTRQPLEPQGDGFGNLLGHLQSLFGQFALGDIPEHHLDADDVSLEVRDRRLRHLHVPFAAVGLPVFVVLPEPTM